MVLGCAESREAEAGVRMPRSVLAFERREGGGTSGRKESGQPTGHAARTQRNSVDVPSTTHRKTGVYRDCSIVTGADSKIARQEQGESTWDPLNASELAPNSANGLIPSLIAWAKSQPPGNDAIVSVYITLGLGLDSQVQGLRA